MGKDGCMVMLVAACSDVFACSHQHLQMFYLLCWCIERTLNPCPSSPYKEAALCPGPFRTVLFGRTSNDSFYTTIYYTWTLTALVLALES